MPTRSRRAALAMSTARFTPKQNPATCASTIRRLRTGVSTMLMLSAIMNCFLLTVLLKQAALFDTAPDAPVSRIEGT